MSYNNKAEEIAITISPIVGACVSFVLSSTMVAMIHRSTTRLTKPYRRIIFFMCIYDIVHSLGVMTSSFLSPQDSGGLWAFGNNSSCSAHGFIVQLGSAAPPLYSASLSICYFYVIKYNMKDHILQKEIEPYLHFIPNVWAWLTSIILISIGYFNHDESGCWIAAYPHGCEHNDVDCVRGQYAFLLRLFFVGIPQLICFPICSITMFMIVTAISKQVSQNLRYRSEIWREAANRSEQVDRSPKNRLQSLFISIFPSNSSTEPMQTEPQATTAFTSVSQIRRNSTSSDTGANTSRRYSRNTSDTTFAHREVRVNPLLRKEKDVKKQSMFFIIAFLCTYSLPFVQRVVEVSTGKSPFLLHLVAKTLNSFQGLFNILVYTRPHVVTLRRRQKELSWFHAFWAVVKKGGDNDQPHTRRNSSIAPRRTSSSLLKAQSSRKNFRLGQATVQSKVVSVEVVEGKFFAQQKAPTSSRNYSFLELRISEANEDELDYGDMQQILTTVAALEKQVLENNDESL